MSGNARNNILHTLVRMSGWRWFHANCLLFQDERYPFTFEKSMCEYSYICTYTYERPFLSNLQIKNVHLRISSNFPNFYIQISIYLGIFSYIFIFSYCLSWFFSHEHIFLFTFHPDHLNFLGLPHNQRLKLVNGLKLYLSLSQIRKVSKLSAISERWKWSFPNLS